MGWGARYLIQHVGKFVTVDADDGTRRRATLVGIGPSGPRVRYSDGTERVAAAWRITTGRDKEQCPGA